MLLRDLQNLLISLYRIDVDVDVHDFLITDERLARILSQTVADRPTDEKLLISEDEDELNVSLYLAAELLERLGELDPRTHLGQSNLADFCTVLEGVSHFNYVAWNATLDKSVTLMEMEMQAEVDKYIVVRALLRDQPKSTLAASLYDDLFTSACFDPALAQHEYVRYRDASAIAGQYCRTLERRFAAQFFEFEMMQDLRRFYRLAQPEKLSHINTQSFP